MNYTVATAKGSRGYQEDAYLAAETKEGYLFGVFDGHGGEEASTYMKRNFLKHFNFYKGLEGAFKASAIQLKDYVSGTTASVVFIPKDKDYVVAAVIGDSPIIVQTPTGIWHSPEHNVRTNVKERDSARARGGSYSGGYIFKSLHGQGLQMSRALGDAELHPVVSSEPELNIVAVAPGGFVLIGTDGLFDPAHHKFEEAAKDVLDLIPSCFSAQTLVDRALAVPTNDNVTAILIKF
jgi:serine/threonine protein phosphatase PrpC